MSTTAVKPAETRDLDADLAICEAATRGPWELADNFRIRTALFPGQVSQSVVTGQWLAIDNDGRFIAEARQGWPYAIQRAQEAEQEVDRLRNELDMLQEQLSQHHSSGCYD